MEMDFQMIVNENQDFICKRFHNYHLIIFEFNFLLDLYNINYLFMPFKLFIKINNVSIFSILLISILLSSCSSRRYLYYIPTPNNPVFTKKGDSKLSAEVVTGMQQGVGSDGAVFQAAYAISDHWAVAYGFDYRKEYSGFVQRDPNSIFTSPQIINNYYDTSSVTVNRNTHEIAIGYFKSINPLNTILFSIYGGYSFGKFNMMETGADSALNYYSRNMNCNLHKLFIQPAFTYHPKKIFLFSFIPRIAVLNYHIINDNYTMGEKKYYKMNITNHDFFLTLEPSFYFSIGIKYIQFITSVSLGGLLSGKPIDVISNNINAGLTLDIANIIRTKKVY